MQHIKGEIITSENSYNVKRNWTLHFKTHTRYKNNSPTQKHLTESTVKETIKAC